MSDKHKEIVEFQGERCRLNGWIQDKHRALQQLDQEAIEREERERAVKLTLRQQDGRGERVLMF